MNKVLSIISKIFKGDKTIWSIVILLSLLSIPILLSSGGRLAYNQYDGAYLKPGLKHVLYIILGFGLMTFFTYMPIAIFRRLSNIGIIVLFTFLMWGFFLSMGSDQTGRSLSLGGSSFQITEVAKLGLIYATAYYISIGQKSTKAKDRSFWTIIITSSMIILPVFLSDFSTAFLMAITILIMMLIGNMPIKKIGLTILFAAMAFLILILASYVSPVKLGRISTIKSRVESYFGDNEIKQDHRMRQVDYAKVAIVRGGIKGTADKSLVSNFLSASHNDFVFAMAIELGGAALGIFLWLLYIVFYVRCYRIMLKSPNTFSAILVCGISTLYVLQAFVNMAVSLNVIPVTGQPLPFVSLGGSSVLVTSVGVGMIQNIAYRSKLEKRVTEEEQDENSLIHKVRQIEDKYAYLQEDDVDFDS
ncbi:FtsW/RodA/SpoVE family cell cycle protein [Halosquirtibacter laminarini]|uniref:FtsW/RodA/SpoVE family cell cycle protein n=1 Tax=Halosquirtibacter laminarini TaxID=3374600 RepID=A0AC61NMJ3_9BACT|nr:FtsW/RodA/SpoVE family cell cycle protein [Prolixibacteraceae bacterium]